MKGLGLKDGWMVKSPVVSRRKQVHHGLSVFFDNKNVLGSNGSVVKSNSDNVPKNLKMETQNEQRSKPQLIVYIRGWTYRMVA